MIQVIITSHGGMAKGMEESVKMLIGEQDNFHCVTLEDGMGAEELDLCFSNIISQPSKENEYLIFCDIKGGTPFNVVSRYSFKNEHITVLYGMNLPTLIVALMEKDQEGQTLKQLVESIEKQMGSTLGISEL